MIWIKWLELHFYSAFIYLVILRPRQQLFNSVHSQKTGVCLPVMMRNICSIWLGEKWFICRKTHLIIWRPGGAGKSGGFMNLLLLFPYRCCNSMYGTGRPDPPLLKMTLFNHRLVFQKNHHRLLPNILWIAPCYILLEGQTDTVKSCGLPNATNVLFSELKCICLKRGLYLPGYTTINFLNKW